MKNKKTSKGITLIALVITIIVLLILAGVSIAMLTGKNGIITQAQNAKNKTEQSTSEEIKKIAKMNAILNEEKYKQNIVEISNLEDLMGVQYYASQENSNFFKGQTIVLKNDIDISSINWEPIPKFYGTFDGQGYSIIGLTSTEGGLFDVIAEGDVSDLNSITTIKNLTLENINIDTDKLWNVGGLVNYIEGRKYNSDITSCKIENCHVRGSIKANDNVGGIVGNLGNCEFFGNSFIGTIEANQYSIGGLIGQITTGNAPFNQITNSYVIADINSNQTEEAYIGFLVGREYSGAATISKCYAYNTNITSDTPNKGIITGGGKPDYLSAGVYENIYTNMDNNGKYGELGSEIINKTTYLTQEEFKNQENFASLDFSKIWSMNSERPYLKSEQ